jgi:hypothetical protein
MGSTPAVKPTTFTLFFFKTGCGTRTIRVSAWLTDSVVGPDRTLRKSASPRYVAVIAWEPMARPLVVSVAVPEPSRGTSFLLILAL